MGEAAGNDTCVFQSQWRAQTPLERTGRVYPEIPLLVLRRQVLTKSGRTSLAEMATDSKNVNTHASGYMNIAMQVGCLFQRDDGCQGVLGGPPLIIKASRYIYLA